MDRVKEFFDVLDYATFRAFLLVLMVIGAGTLVKVVHGRNRGGDPE